MDWNVWIRQFHRWLSIAFTLAVIVNVVALVQDKQVVWVGILALLPLALLTLTRATTRATSTFIRKARSTKRSSLPG